MKEVNSVFYKSLILLKWFVLHLSRDKKDDISGNFNKGCFK